MDKKFINFAEDVAYSASCLLALEHYFRPYARDSDVTNCNKNLYQYGSHGIAHAPCLHALA